MGTLRKDTWPNGYIWSGPIDDLAPGRRTVERLELRKVGDIDVEGLRVLQRFPDLRQLFLLDGGDVHLDGLDGLPLERLRIGGIASVDLRPVANLPALRDLGVGECGIRNPEGLRFPETLDALILTFEEDVETLPHLASAIDWEGLRGLRTLIVHGDPDAPVSVDLSFLRHLPELDRLDLFEGVWHAGPGPSPLDPPFEGLSRKLSWIRIDAWDPDTVKPALAAYLVRDADHPPTVYQRYAPRKRRVPWEPFADPNGWQVYGSLHDAAADDDIETEYDAAEAAERKLRKADRALAARIEFDPENAGTGIYAKSREDLERVLAILELGQR
ncbi:hypothetical protein AB0L40_11010 [Patulibacter sp. NPDC049589]|uniref:hypothetical protein n=1 Tax=Patulibacter sp. NPDC049589 TaxID=3154731 RepID=UPI0034174A50